ncbi:DEAD/DEAH box helicase [Paratissierella segnis]|uniref:DEAD/DEAH box helicase n=1 Tax=Paratissierella segnis TaxID=2763679 RepID=A0A926EVL3_9FIRM|nr:DEAD/DEAH box helicase [Paratissierella segnis]MBC8587124.1 DEAD/DEAH box helicase [Paratissierella segnis]
MKLGAFKIEGVDTNEFNNQINFLKEEILNGKNKNRFSVINGEAGLGKTLYTEQALAKLALQNRKAIFVRKFVEDCVGSAKRINKQCKKEVAIAIHTGNYKELKEILDSYNILVITHKRYIDLSKNKAERKLFTQNREVLVIDEEIDMLDEMVYTTNRIEEFDSLLERGIIRDLYNICTKEIESFLKTNKTRTFFKTSINVSKELKQLKNLITNSRLREFVKTDIIFDNNIETAIISKDDKEILMTKSDFIKEIEVLENFINHVCYVENSFMYSYDRQIKFWKLENNLVLDATASVNYIYSISKQFTVKKDKKVVNHKNWIMYIVKQNTTKSNKAKTENIYDVINKEINNIALFGDLDKTLIIGNKEEQKYIHTSKYIDYAWFGNITGKNDWKDFSKAFIIHNPQFPFHTYIAKYQLYAGEKALLKENLGIVRNGQVVRFISQKLEKLRQTTIASEIYQAIKRINRLNSQNAEVYFMNNDNEIIDIVISQFKNINVKEYKLEEEIKYKETKMDLYNKKRQENSYAVAFIKLLSTLEKGKYKKSLLREQIGYKNNNTFARDVLNKIEVAEYMSANSIVTKGQSVIVN